MNSTELEFTGISLKSGFYHITEKLGDGAFGSVYKAIRGPSTFALKILNTNDPLRIQLFEQEIFLHQLAGSHPNIVRLIDHDIVDTSSGKRFFLLLDYCDTILSPNSVLNSELLAIMSDISKSLYHIHSLSPSLIHRDIKVENILYCSKTKSYKLCDFGSSTTTILTPTDRQSRLVIESELSKLTTPAYRSPEMVDLYRSSSLGPFCDVWAFGVALFVLSFGTLPFGDGTNKLSITNRKLVFPSKNRPQIVLDVIERCLDKNIKTRITARELVKMIDPDFVGEITTNRAQSEVLRAEDSFSFDTSSFDWPGDSQSISQSHSEPQSDSFDFDSSFFPSSSTNPPTSATEFDFDSAFSTVVEETVKPTIQVPTKQTTKIKKVPLFFTNDFVPSAVPKDLTHDLPRRSPSPPPSRPPLHPCTPPISRTFETSFTEEDNINPITTSELVKSKAKYLANNLVSFFDSDTPRSSITKATSNDNSIPKCKHLRNVLISLYEQSSTNVFSIICTKISPLAVNHLITLKCIYLCVYLLQEGPSFSAGKLREVYDVMESNIGSNILNNSVFKFLYEMMNFRLKDGCLLESNLSLDSALNLLINQKKFKEVTTADSLQKWFILYELLITKLGNSFLNSLYDYIVNLVQCIRSNLKQLERNASYFACLIELELERSLSVFLFLFITGKAMNSEITITQSNLIDLLRPVCSVGCNLYSLLSEFIEISNFTSSSQFVNYLRETTIRPPQSLEPDVCIAVTSRCSFLKISH
ncbi:hypothetical protein RCL1_005366 [Eukaryota sp. TZLM3-RCL]